jgi:hypothetical protein
MRILILADNDAFTWTGPCHPVDLVVSCGDVYDPLILTAAKACSATQILAVKGNHDLPASFTPPIVDLHLRVVTLPNGMRIGGFNGSWRYKPRGNFLYSQDEAAALIGQLPPVDILVTHNSPQGIHERDADVHQGFAALSDYIGNCVRQNLIALLYFHGDRTFHLLAFLGLVSRQGTSAPALLPEIHPREFSLRTGLDQRPDPGETGLARSSPAGRMEGRAGRRWTIRVVIGIFSGTGQQARTMGERFIATDQCDLLKIIE